MTTLIFKLKAGYLSEYLIQDNFQLKRNLIQYFLKHLKKLCSNKYLKYNKNKSK